MKRPLPIALVSAIILAFVGAVGLLVQRARQLIRDGASRRAREAATDVCAIVPGMVLAAPVKLGGNAEVVLARRDGVLTLDEATLQFDDDDSPFVAVQVDAQVFERRQVEVGLSDGLRIEITGELTAGDREKRHVGKPS